MKITHFYAYFGQNCYFKGRVHCFSMQAVMNKCFLLNPEKEFGADLNCRFREKNAQNAPLIPKMTSQSRKLEGWATLITS